MAWVEEVVFKQRLHGSNSVRNLAHVRHGKLAMLQLLFADDQLSTALEMSKESAYARVYMGFACQAYAANCPKEAQVDLSRALELDPSLCLNDADRLLEIVAAYAWNHMTADPFEFTNRVFSNLPDDHSDLRWLTRRAVARTWLVGAFRAYQYNDMPRVRENALKALAAAPSLVRNRGLVSVLARSLLGSHRVRERESA